MKRSETQPLNNLLKAYVKAMGLKKPLTERNAKQMWDKLMGPSISSKTSSVYLKNKVLFIKLTSAPLKNELVMMQTQIIDRFNELAGENIINKVVIQ